MCTHKAGNVHVRACGPPTRRHWARAGRGAHACGATCAGCERATSRVVRCGGAPSCDTNSGKRRLRAHTTGSDQVPQNLVTKPVKTKATCSGAEARAVRLLPCWLQGACSIGKPTRAGSLLVEAAQRLLDSTMRT